MRPVKASLFGILLGSSAWAQQPLSAIDWLDDPGALTIAQPRVAPVDEPPVTNGIATPTVQVMPLDAPRPDAVGLLASATTGLPKTLWQESATANLISQINQLSAASLPAIQALYYTLLLAEADPPSDAESDARLLRARLQALQRFGAVDTAIALIERASPATKILFDPWLDLSLLNGSEGPACDALNSNPSLTPRYAARVYCIARAGNWQTAALTFETAAALGTIDPLQADLLALYLDPELIDSNTSPPPPKTMTPLVFRLYEAAGTPLPTRRLPRAYATADLRDTAGWKSQIEAAERLAQTGALPATRLLGIYTARKPAASGGVWDRVKLIQQLDLALRQSDDDSLDAILPAAWETFRSRGLALPFAQLFANDLRGATLPPKLRETAFEIALLSPDYEEAATAFQTSNLRLIFLKGLAQGAPDPASARSALAKAIARGFSDAPLPAAHQRLIDQGKLGEAILTAALQLDRAASGQLADITGALAALRAVGLEDTARRAALQMVVLETPQ